MRKESVQMGAFGTCSQQYGIVSIEQGMGEVVFKDE